MINYRKLLYDYARPVEVWEKTNADNERRLRFLKYEAVGNSQHKFTEILTNKAHRMNRKLDLQLENEVSRLAKTHGTNCYEIQRTQEQIQNEEKDTLKKKPTSSKYDRLLNTKSTTPVRSSLSTSIHPIDQQTNDAWVTTLRALLISNKIKSNRRLTRGESTLSIGSLNHLKDSTSSPLDISLSHLKATPIIPCHPTSVHSSTNTKHKSISKSLPTLSRNTKKNQSRNTTINPPRRTATDPLTEKSKAHKYYVRSTYSFSRDISTAGPRNKISSVYLMQLTPEAKYSDGVTIACTKYT